MQRRWFLPWLHNFKGWTLHKNHAYSGRHNSLNIQVPCRKGCFYYLWKGDTFPFTYTHAWQHDNDNVHLLIICNRSLVVDGKINKLILHVCTTTEVVIAERSLLLVNITRILYTDLQQLKHYPILPVKFSYLMI